MTGLATWIVWAVGSAAIAAAPTRSTARLPLSPHRSTARPPAQDLPDAKITLSLEAPTARGPWTMRITNEGAVPARVVADARWLALDVTPRGQRRPTHCELPATMRPGDPLERTITLPPGRAVFEVFEPRLYCFGRKGFDALDQGAIVVARLGFAAGGSRGPWVVSPAVVAGPLAPRRWLDALPIMLPGDPPATVADASLNPGTDSAAGSSLVLNPTAAVDASSPSDIDISVTLRNEGSSPVTVRFRPEVLGFQVTGTSVSERCVWPVAPSVPTREGFDTIRPGGALALTIALASYCGGHAFDRAGLLRVQPWLDTRNTSGKGVGLRTFDGTVVSRAATFVRLARGRLGELLEQPVLSPP